MSTSLRYFDTALESILGNKSKRSPAASKLLASTPRFWSTAKSELSLAMLD